MRSVVAASPHRETLNRILEAISRRGLTVFTQIDHAAAAREAGMDLADEVVVVFGNPRAGTPLMQLDPRIGIELPLRLLLWVHEGEVRIGYEDPRELASRYDVGPQAETLEAMASLLAQIAREAAGEGRAPT
jgi:uncharacterized protein (DUF302 family)